MPPVFRFAPSPNGELHLGHAYSALLGFEMSRRLGGRFLLRIEDIDPARCRPEYEQAIYRDLAWLGLEWEEPVRRQSEHMENYRAAGENLRRIGVAYPSFMSRAEIAAATADPTWPRAPDGSALYPEGDRALSRSEADSRIADGAAYALRIDTNKAVALAGHLTWQEMENTNEGKAEFIQAKPEIWGDFVIARKDVPTAYHLAVVVDDDAQGVTHVVRGRDLYATTAAHRLLQNLLDIAAPVYHHHALITDETGQKLSKADRATSLGAHREAGATPADIRRIVGIDETLGQLG